MHFKRGGMTDIIVLTTKILGLTVIDKKKYIHDYTNSVQKYQYKPVHVNHARYEIVYVCLKINIVRNCVLLFSDVNFIVHYVS